MSRLTSAFAAAALIVLAGPVAAQTYSASANYANPDATTTASYRTRGPCNDPWVTIALERVYGRADASYCATILYNGGRWNDFNQLVHAVAATRSSLMRSNIVLRGGYLGDPSKPAIAIFQGGRIVGAGAGNIVGAGAGNIVAAGAGNIIAAGGGNIVGAGAGNLRYDAPGARRLQSAGSVSLPTGSLSW